MQHSETIDIIADALIAAKKKFSPALKHSVNPHFNSKYVDLAGALEATEAALSENGITVLQSPEGSVADRSVTITTRLLHKSGQWIQGELTLPAAGQRGYDAQSVGSAITYGRRYAYMGMLGIAPEDDDGNGASVSPNGNGKELQRKSTKDPQAGRRVSDIDDYLNRDEPLFDEHGEVVEAAPNPPKPPKGKAASTVAEVIHKTSGRTVTVPMSKRFIAIALTRRIERGGMSSNEAWEEINDYLGGLGLERAEEMLSKDYDAACAWAEQ